MEGDQVCQAGRYETGASVAISPAVNVLPFLHHLLSKERGGRVLPPVTRWIIQFLPFQMQLRLRLSLRLLLDVKPGASVLPFLR